MSEPDFIDRLLAHSDVLPREPSSNAVIERLPSYFDGPIPEELLRLWNAGDGIDLPTIGAHVIGPTQLLSLLEAGWNMDRAFVPVLDDHESNLAAVIVAGPLAPRVAHIPHDADSRMLYRNLDSFAQGLLELLDGGDDAGSAVSFNDEIAGDYPPDGPRTADDQNAACSLLATQVNREQWNHAAQLLDDSDLAAWIKLLETDSFVRRNVIDRMRQMRSPAIQELLKQDQKEFERFFLATAKAARARGLEIDGQTGEALQIERRWMDLGMFFYRRNIPNAEARMLDWFEDLIARRNPRDRAGHFMSD